MADFGGFHFHSMEGVELVEFAWLFKMSCNIPEPVDVLKAVFIEALPPDIQEIITESCLEADVDILLDMVEQLEVSPTDRWSEIVRTQMQRLPAMPAPLLI